MQRLLAASLLLATSLAAAAAARPNVILVLADDVGYECLSVNGGAPYRTPHLDRLAAAGVRFTRCHAQTVCTPTRVQLMTGHYNVRNYTDFGSMDPALRTFGNDFRDAGYATAIAGKWQLGVQPDLPTRFGFDRHCLWQHTRRGDEKTERYRNAGLEIDGVMLEFTDGTYGPDVVHRYALDFIAAHRARPFFLYYSMILGHSPFEPTPDSPDYGADKKRVAARKLATGAEATDPHFVEMIAYMDKQIGELVAHLDRLGLAENTLLLFVGDNGTHKSIRSTLDGRTILGGKGRTTVEALRVPLIASWPGRIRAGAVCDDLVDTTDFLPTMAEAAALAPASGGVPWDGISFLPQLRGERGHPREWFYCWYAPQRELLAEFAADREFKLTRAGELFDLRADPEERSPLPLSAQAPARSRLQSALDRFIEARPAALRAR